MATTVERRAELNKEYRRHEQDTGSPEVQIALLTDRINYLTEHLKQLKKDQSSRRGLLQLVSRRNSLLRYLSRTNREQYKSVIARLGLRK